MPATEAELRDLYERYAHVIHHRARLLLGSDEEAADAVQETFARVIRHWDGFRQQSSPLTWMVQISTNYCLNRMRDQRGHRQKHEHRRHDIVGDGYSRDPEPGQRVDLVRLRAMLEDEDEETRQIVLYLYFDDLTREDTARLVGISVPTLRKRHDAFLRRARRLLAIAPLAASVVALSLLVLQVRG